MAAPVFGGASSELHCREMNVCKHRSVLRSLNCTHDQETFACGALVLYLQRVVTRLLYEWFPPSLHQQQCDVLATSMLTPELGKTYVAYWVRGDGNCFWRAITKGLWGSDEYWQQVKLVVLAWTAARGQDLLDDDDATIYVSNEIYSRHSVFDANGNRTGDDGSFYKMLLESVVVFCEPGEWGGDITALMVSQAFGITVKVVVPTDMDARKRRDNEDNPSPFGTGRDGSNMEDDCRQSRSFVPHGPPRTWHMPAMNGKGFVDREEVVVAMTTGSSNPVLESKLTGLPDVHESTNGSKLCHFAAVVNKTGGAWPFPLHKAAPALLKTHVSDVLSRDWLFDQTGKPLTPLLCIGFTLRPIVVVHSFRMLGRAYLGKLHVAPA